MSVRERARRLFGGRQQTQVHTPVQFPSVPGHGGPELGHSGDLSNASSASIKRPTRPSRPESFHMLDMYDENQSVVGSKASIVARHGPSDSAALPYHDSSQSNYSYSKRRADDEGFYPKSSLSNDGHTDVDGYLGTIATGPAFHVEEPRDGSEVIGAPHLPRHMDSVGLPSNPAAHLHLRRPPPPPPPSSALPPVPPKTVIINNSTKTPMQVKSTTNQYNNSSNLKLPTLKPLNTNIHHPHPQRNTPSSATPSISPSQSLSPTFSPASFGNGNGGGNLSRSQTTGRYSPLAAFLGKTPSPSPSPSPSAPSNLYSYASDYILPDDDATPQPTRNENELQRQQRKQSLPPPKSQQPPQRQKHQSAQSQLEEENLRLQRLDEELQKKRELEQKRQQDEERKIQRELQKRLQAQQEIEEEQREQGQLEKERERKRQLELEAQGRLRKEMQEKQILVDEEKAEKEQKEEEERISEQEHKEKDVQRKLALEEDHQRKLLVEQEQQRKQRERDEEEKKKEQRQRLLANYYRQQPQQLQVQLQEPAVEEHQYRLVMEQQDNPHKTTIEEEHDQVVDTVAQDQEAQNTLTEKDEQHEEDHEVEIEAQETTRNKVVPSPSLTPASILTIPTEEQKNLAAKIEREKKEAEVQRAHHAAEEKEEELERKTQQQMELEKKKQPEKEAEKKKHGEEVKSNSTTRSSPTRTNGNHSLSSSPPRSLSTSSRKIPEPLSFRQTSLPNRSPTRSPSTSPFKSSPTKSPISTKTLKKLPSSKTLSKSPKEVPSKAELPKLPSVSPKKADERTASTSAVPSSVKPSADSSKPLSSSSSPSKSNANRITRSSAESSDDTTKISNDTKDEPAAELEDADKDEGSEKPALHPRFEYALSHHTILANIISYLDYRSFRTLKLISSPLRKSLLNSEQSIHVILNRYLSEFGYEDDSSPSIVSSTTSNSLSNDAGQQQTPTKNGNNSRYYGGNGYAYAYADYDDDGDDEEIGNGGVPAFPNSISTKSLPAIKKPSLTLRDLDGFMAALEFSTSEFAELARQDRHRSLDIITLRMLKMCTRSWNRVVIHIRSQAILSPSSSSNNSSTPLSPQKSPHVLGSNASMTSISNKSKLVYRPGRALLLRAWVPTVSNWMTDDEVVEAERELWRSGIWSSLRKGDIIHNVACGDFGNEGKLIFDSKYLRDLAYSFDPVGHLPSWLNALTFSPSYFHNVIASSTSDPVIYADLVPFGEQIKQTLSLCQETMEIEQAQGKYRVATYKYRAVIKIVNGMVLGNTSDQNGRTTRGDSSSKNIEVAHPDWEGQIILQTDGTIEHARTLLAICGQAPDLQQLQSPQSPQSPHKFQSPGKNNNSPHAKRSSNDMHAWRVLRSRSRPGKIWLRTLSDEEKVA